MSKRDVSPEIKEPRKQSKKPKKKHRFFYRKKNFKIKFKMAALCYASRKPIHTPILLRHLDVSRKKFKPEPEVLDCAPPENGSKTTPNP